VLLIAYITGFFAKPSRQYVQLSELQILAIFGERQPLHHLRGTYGVVVTEVLHFVILLAGSTVFMFTAVAQNGGWTQCWDALPPHAGSAEPDPARPLGRSGSLDRL